MTYWIALWLQLASPAAHAEGGTGVKNGGTAVACEDRMQRPIMLELAEILEDQGEVDRIEDRALFFNNVFAILTRINTDESWKLAAQLQEVLRAHGPSQNWSQTPYKYATILSEDYWSLRQLKYVDWLTGTVYLKNRCRIIPISYLTPAPGQLPKPPMLIGSNVKQLDAYNVNVLELHEAFYEIFVLRNLLSVNVLPTRGLIRVLLNKRSTLEQMSEEVTRFMTMQHLYPMAPPNPGIPWLQPNPYVGRGRDVQP